MAEPEILETLDEERVELAEPEVEDADPDEEAVDETDPEAELDARAAEHSC